MQTPEQKARRIFGEHAAYYATSASHTEKAVLQQLIEWACPEPGWRMLDIATGAGHTALAFAPHVESVVAIDLTPEMILQARSLRDQTAHSNLVFALADVHALPFDGNTFDMATTRRAPHHFSHIHLALREIHRVLRPGGRLLVDDRSVPEDDFVDTCMNELDRYHDESHVRQYRVSEWRELLKTAGFHLDAVEPYTRHRPVTSLTETARKENARLILAVLDGLTLAQRSALNLREVNGELHINHWYVMISAVKPLG